MTRIGTFQAQQSALLNLQRASAREAAASEAVTTGRKADDFAGFGRGAEGVTALKTVQARTANWREQASALAGKLESQDAYLTQAMDAASQARLAIGEAVALDHGDGLLARISAAFGQAAAALNGKHGGEYLFAGGRLDAPPFAATSLDGVTSTPLVSDLFGNDGLRSTARLDDALTVVTGELASEVGGAMMESFARFQAFVEGPDGDFRGKLTAAQREFLQGEMASWQTAEAGVIQVVARNGAAQARVEDQLTRLDDRATSLEGLLADRTDVDPFEAVSRLQQAQLAVEATAKVFTTLKASSLLDLLR